jgi:hypothetical protein
MNLRELVAADVAPRQVYSEPYETADGTTIITVTRFRLISGAAAPVGVFVIHGGKVRWEPASDATRIVLLAEFTGLAAAVIATLAMLRRPPWPDMHLTGRIR